jgi:hypothetical protein
MNGEGAAEQLIQPERNQLAFHPLDLKAGFDSFRPVNSSVRRLKLKDVLEYWCNRETGRRISTL